MCGPGGQAVQLFLFHKDDREAALVRLGSQKADLCCLGAPPGFVDQDAQLLLDALGEPQQKLYEASCSGPGDDGIWIYDGLTVFTYLENGVETVVDAE